MVRANVMISVLIFHQNNLRSVNDSQRNFHSKRESLNTNMPPIEPSRHITVRVFYNF